MALKKIPGRFLVATVKDGSRRGCLLCTIVESRLEGRDSLWRGHRDSDALAFYLDDNVPGILGLYLRHDELGTSSLVRDQSRLLLVCMLLSSRSYIHDETEVCSHSYSSNLLKANKGLAWKSCCSWVHRVRRT